MADEGTYSNAMTYAHGSIVLNVQEWQKGDVIDSSYRVKAFADSVSANQITYDSIGVGAGVKAHMKRVAKRQVNGFNAAESVFESDNNYIGVFCS